MADATEYLLLKWGTLKACNVVNAASIDILQKYTDAGISMSVMAQKDTPEQKELLCRLIDAIDGQITKDWTDEDLTKEAAKKYIREYPNG